MMAVKTLVSDPLSKPSHKCQTEIILNVVIQWSWPYGYHNAQRAEWLPLCSRDTDILEDASIGNKTMFYTPKFLQPHWFTHPLPHVYIRLDSSEVTKVAHAGVAVSISFPTVYVFMSRRAVEDSFVHGPESNFCKVSLKVEQRWERNSSGPLPSLCTKPHRCI